MGARLLVDEAITKTDSGIVDDLGLWIRQELFVAAMRGNEALRMGRMRHRGRMRDIGRICLIGPISVSLRCIHPLRMSNPTPFTQLLSIAELFAGCNSSII